MAVRFLTLATGGELITRRVAPRPSSGGSKEPTVPSIFPYSITRTFSVQSVSVNTSDLNSFDIATEMSN